MSFPDIALTPEIEDALAGDCEVVFSLSGGKDSSAAALAVIAHLDRIGHPRAHRHAIHADLGQIEWRSTAGFVEAIAEKLETPLTMVRRNGGGLIQRWQQRWQSACKRYAAMETYQLISPFSSAKLRFCTSETKVAPIGSHLRKAFKGRTIISVVGIRREESLGRAKAPIAKADHRFAAPGNRAGTRMLTWHPLVDWTAQDVFDLHETTGFPLHEAYTRYDATRLSCSYCVLASLHNLERSSACAANAPTYRRIVDLEIGSGFSFQPERWLADVSPHLLTAQQRERLPLAKASGERRRALEATLPNDLRFRKGWPPRVPSPAEATIIAGVRAIVLAQAGVTSPYISATDIRERFKELHAAR